VANCFQKPVRVGPQPLGATRSRSGRESARTRIAAPLPSWSTPSRTWWGDQRSLRLQPQLKPVQWIRPTPWRNSPTSAPNHAPLRPQAGPLHPERRVCCPATSPGRTKRRICPMNAGRSECRPIGSLGHPSPVELNTASSTTPSGGCRTASSTSKNDPSTSPLTWKRVPRPASLGRCASHRTPTGPHHGAGDVVPVRLPAGLIETVPRQQSIPYSSTSLLLRPQARFGRHYPCPFPEH